MLRFLLETTTRDQGHVYSELSTIEVNCPELEARLKSGGYGAGPNGDDFSYTKLLGVEK